MKRRTQLYLEEDQYRWLRREAGPDGSIAEVVRRLIDRARRRPDPSDDPLVAFLMGDGFRGQSRGADTLDEDVYG